MTQAPAHPGDVTAAAVAQMFNSTVAGFAIGAAWQLGALDRLHEQGTLDAVQFAGQNDLDLSSTRGMFAALASTGVVLRSGDTISAGPLFAETFRNKAFFHWLTIGCAELFADMPNVMRNGNRTGAFYRRDAAAIGYACRDINRLSFDPIFWDVLAGLDFSFTTVADLGCGSGGRLVQIADRYPGTRGVGVDLAPSALRDAEVYAREQGCEDRLEFVTGNVLELQPDPRFEKVELLTCFMMGHDFWPRERCVATLRRLRSTFPNVRRFLLGDTARTQGIADTGMPVFNLAFEVAHDLMGAYLPTLPEWQGVFADSGWECRKVHQVPVPTDSVVYELA